MNELVGVIFAASAVLTPIDRGASWLSFRRTQSPIFRCRRLKWGRFAIPRAVVAASLRVPSKLNASAAMFQVQFGKDGISGTSPGLRLLYHFCRIPFDV